MGLTPRQFQSGQMDRQGRISGKGNALLRALLVEVSGWPCDIIAGRRRRMSVFCEVIHPVRRGDCGGGTEVIGAVLGDAAGW
ncbi:MAG: transposase [Planctomycetes bacterium]|nr:transposase [Planctomycetota bacterium]